MIEDFKDRVPTKVLENGAVRYAVYDENENFLRYEYILRADEPVETGNVWNKAVYDGIKHDIENQKCFFLEASENIVTDGESDVVKEYLLDDARIIMITFEGTFVNNTINCVLFFDCVANKIIFVTNGKGEIKINLDASDMEYELSYGSYAHIITIKKIYYDGDTKKISFTLNNSHDTWEAIYNMKIYSLTDKI